MKKRGCKRMNLMNALLDTYNFALENDLVDNHKLSNLGHIILPIYHSNKRSSGEDIFQITIDEEGKPIGGRFLNKDELIIFPITEESITRSGSKVAPHPICDELSYLSGKIDERKNKAYLEGIDKLLEYEESNKNENMRIIGQYVKNNDILDDFLRYFMNDKDYQMNDEWQLKYEVQETSGKVRSRTLDLKKVFIEFKINKLLEADITLTRDVAIHKFYIDYINNINKNKDLTYCNILGEEEYCTDKHRGIIKRAKIISANNPKTYYGRIKSASDVYRMSFEASQKVHNMLKFFIDSDKYKKHIGENAYLVNWLAQDLDKGGIDLISDMEYEEDEVEEVTLEDLGDLISQKLGNYFLGGGGEINPQDTFYIIIIEKINDGRVSIKYFRRLSRSEAYERVRNWYKSTEWSFYDYKLKKYIGKSPSLYQIINFIYGMENNKGYMSCENKKLMRTSIERLIPCIIDSKKIPKDIMRASFNKLSNKRAFNKSWNEALNIGCSLIKKDLYDYKDLMIYHNRLEEVDFLKESRSFYYGRLIAIYEKVELDAIRGRTGDDGKNGGRITNADRLWNSMTRTPERTRFILENKIKPYMNILKRNSMGLYIFHDKLLTEITIKISELDESTNQNIGPLNEDFILGYYYQKNDFYNKKDKDLSSDNLDNKGDEQ